MKSMFNGAGYVMNDNRASGGVLREDDIISCVSCQAAIDKSKWREQGAFCHALGGPICSFCDRCRPLADLEPFEKRFARAIEENYRKEQNAKILGLPR